MSESEDIPKYPQDYKSRKLPNSENSSNPVYLFIEMTKLFQKSIEHEIDNLPAEEFTQENWEKARISAIARTQFPPRLMEYLFQIGDAVVALASGLDSRNCPQCQSDSPEAQREFHRAYKDWYSTRLSPIASMKALPGMIGLARPGWNAFSAFRRDMLVADARSHYGAARYRGLSRPEALEEIADVYGYDEIRSVERLIADPPTSRPDDD